MLTAHSSEGFTLFAIPLSLAEVALLGQDVVNMQFIKAGAVRRAVEAAIKTRSVEIRKQFLRDFDYRYGEVDVTAGFKTLTNRKLKFPRFDRARNRCREQLVELLDISSYPH